MLLASLGLVALPLPTAQAAPPSNDDFADAVLISDFGVVSGTNLEATRETGEPAHAGYSDGASVWYRWVAPAGVGNVVLEIPEADFDTTLAIYTGSAVNALTSIEFDDDGGNDTLSRIVLTPTVGTTYYFAVDACCGGFGDVQTGSFDLRLSEDLPTGTVHGTVTRTNPADPSGPAIAADLICVMAVDDAGRRVTRSTRTDVDGTYSFAVPPGTYHLKFRNCGLDNVAGEYYDDAQTLGVSADLVVTQGGDLTRDARLEVGGSITGTLSADPSVLPGTALDGICVRATMVGGSDNGFSLQTITDTNGAYTLTGLDGGQYRIQFAGGCGPNQTFAQEYYNDSATSGAATLVTATEGTLLEDIDATLLGVPGAIAGTVTAWTTGDPVQNICVRTVSPSVSGYVYTNATGNYTIPNVPAGSSWVVEFSDCNAVGPPYTTQFYNTTTSQTAAEQIQVFAGQTQGGINARMFVAGTLSGRITDENGNGRSPACVNVHLADGHTILGVQTDVDGTWSATVPPGNYELEMTDCGSGGLEFETRWYLDALNQAGAQEIFVDQGDTVANLNQVLPGVPGTDGRIVGKVTDDSAGQVPLEGICVTATRAGIPTDTTSLSDGRYEFGNLFPGTYTVLFQQCDVDAPYNVLPQYWDDVPAYTGDTPTNVVVTSGNTSAGIVAHMHAAGSIDGVLTNVGGTQDLQGVCVSAYTDPAGGPIAQDFTNANGEFHIVGLTTGVYFVQIEDCSNEYVGQWYQGVPFVSVNDPSPDGDPTSVDVDQGVSTDLGTIELERWGTITGTVTNEAGDPLENVCVFVENPDSTYDPPQFPAETDVDGHYLVGGLKTTTDPSNEYLIRYQDCGVPGPDTYGTEWWDNKLSDGTADPIPAVMGEDTPNIDAVLQTEAPVNITPPDINGQASVGMTIKATNGTWEHDPGEFSYEWYRCDADGTNCIPADSGPRKYLISDADLGHRLRVDVTAFNSIGDDTASSALTPVVNDDPPVNDDIQDRVVLGSALPLDLFGSNVRATRQTGEPKHLGLPIGASVWYAWTAPSGPSAIQSLTIDLDGSDYLDTVSVYDGTPVPLTGLDLVAEDDGSGPNGNSLVTFTPDPGTTYYIAVDGAWDGSEVSTGTIEMRLSEGTGIAGTVTDANGDPVRTICVDAEDTTTFADYQTLTGADGTYLIDAPAGTYTVGYTDCVGEYDDQYYDGVTDPGDATDVVVTDGAITEDIDATLVRAQEYGSISGVITDEDGDPLPNICVLPVDPLYGPLVLSADCTDQDGTYQLRGLGDPNAGPDDPPLEYYVVFDDCGCFYGSELYDNALDPDDATLVPVGRDEQVTGIDATLQWQAPVNTTLPTVTGNTGDVGSTLTATNGAWDHEPSLFTYQWLRCDSGGTSCLPISGADQGTYITTSDDLGLRLKVVVTAANSIGDTDATSTASNRVGAPMPVAAPVVTGTPAVGNTLSASTGTWTGSPDSYAYQWQRCNNAVSSCTAIDGATTSTHQVTTDDSGFRLRIRVIATNTVGSTSNWSTGTAIAGSPSPVSMPVITGTPSVGNSLTASTGTWTGSPDSYAYQWQRCNTAVSSCTAIDGATTNSYQVTTDDSGFRLRIRVIATNTVGSTSNWSTGTAIAGSPSPVSMPVITGTPSVGNSLTASTGTWTGSPSSYAYQWQRCNTAVSSCTAIDGATTNSYQVTTDDSGFRLRIRVIATNSVGSASNWSTATAIAGSPGTVSAPVVTGAPNVGNTLTASTGTWTTSDNAHDYQWQRCNNEVSSCTAIGGATSSTYQVTTDDSGFRLRVRLIATNTIGSTPIWSAATAIAGSPGTISAPVIAGTPTVGNTLSSPTGTWTGSPDSYGYQWQRCNNAVTSCTAIDGATTNSYQVTTDDSGFRLRIRVIATNTIGSTPIWSVATAGAH